jgi:hypothetical protein
MTNGKPRLSTGEIVNIVLEADRAGVQDRGQPIGTLKERRAAAIAF